ncbi:xanthine dehydrogenase family protein molybdopterin-binding subunit [Pseudomonas luteola]|uniref:Xanthine dehydrogenase family protein molybdopterin-binding subunit n=1 Tax=Pseudomonas luteola TaxID=47886 RepID=A0ABS0FTN7_PSELU|nr:xanthine dehydrogenase family protein molybdopterin-binding subunit [Pseudomonas zeshuii]MBF8643745.1 xanthine dehydrogenase family protein molybdopterin-binding subunit [Pseudomonas zeshuii]
MRVQAFRSVRVDRGHAAYAAPFVRRTGSIQTPGTVRSTAGPHVNGRLPDQTKRRAAFMGTVMRTPNRLEAREKVTGTACYTVDLARSPVEGRLAHAAVVQSTQATGRILSIDTTAALAVPGVQLIMTHLDAPRLKPINTLPGGELAVFRPLQDDQLHYNGQPIALVVADTAEQAQRAASLVAVGYAPPAHPPLLVLDETQAETPDVVGAGEPAVTERGDPDAAFTTADQRLEQEYCTQPHHHNALEPGAAIAAWDEAGRLTVQLGTQYAYGDAYGLAQAFDLGVKKDFKAVMKTGSAEPALNEKVRLIVPFVGGAFGGKKGNIHPLLAAMAAKQAGRPVKLVLSRRQTFSMMPFRGATRQRIRLGGSADGRLSVMLQEALVQNSTTSNFIEPVGEMTPKLYACQHLRTHHRTTRLAINAPSWMRAPGVAVSQFALESAMDEWAYHVGLDPLEVRLRNYAEHEPQSGHEWSSKSLRQCYQAAAERIDWTQRNPAPGSMHENQFRVGYGMATSLYHVAQMAASARVRLNADGTAVASSATHEIGQGGMTALTQLAAEALGLPLDRVRLEWGDTRLPYSSLTASSSTTLSIGAAIHAAARQLKHKLARLAVGDPVSPLNGLNPETLRLCEGRLVSETGQGEAITVLLVRHGLASLEAEAGTADELGKPAYGRAAFGAQFVRVRVDPLTGRIRIDRLVGAFAGGRIVNPTLAHSQLVGGMIWGLGQALMEETRLDEGTGRWMNADLSEALIMTQADVPDIEAIMIEEDDRRGHPLGIKGLGEIGVVGVAAAVANAVFHATGKRIRTLPITLDKLMA